ncbi:MAG: hypothetical protein P1U90_14200, partial [Akkermansiaceae bacterium]|nr:hypothetical protein [Akkermansiaceae bacterium]
ADSVWAVIYFDDAAHNSTTTSSIIINGQNGIFSADGFSLHLNRQNSSGDLLHKVTGYFTGGDSTVLYIRHNFVGWALVGYSYDSSTNQRKVFCSPLAALGSQAITETSSISSYTAAIDLQIGRGSYTHVGSGTVDGAQVALVGYAPEYLEAEQIESVIAHAEAQLGITL